MKQTDLDADRKKNAYVRIARRVILLWMFGMVVQGNLLGLAPRYFRYYSNTLQAIASGYLISSVLYLNLKPKWQVVAVVFLLLLYWVPTTFLGDFTPEGNFPMKVDRAILWALYRSRVFVRLYARFHRTKTCR